MVQVLNAITQKWTHNVQGINSFNSYQVITYPHKIYLQYLMATWCDNYSPLNDKFCLAMQMSQIVSIIKRAMDTTDCCSTSGDSISNCLCNFKEIRIKLRPNVHINRKHFENWNRCVTKWRLLKTHYKWIAIKFRRSHHVRIIYERHHIQVRVFLRLLKQLMHSNQQY
jgi:hypothetical protein